MKVHEIVMEWVTAELSSGRLRIGDHLPGERTLAETIGVSRSSLREAMRVLEVLGTISSSTGSGPRSGTIVTADPAQALTLALNLQLATSQVGHEHIYEVRQLLEAWSTARSMETLGDWAAIAVVLDRMDDPEISVADFLVLDAEFHVLLSQSAGNPLISTLMEALRTSIAEHTLSRANAIADWGATSARLRGEHRGIVMALHDADHGLAASRMRAHIEGYYQETTR